ncbi:hypothetical protein Tco_1459377 [Tanacetum coccineum]
MGIKIDDFVEGMDDLYDDLDLGILTNDVVNLPVKPEFFGIGIRVHRHNPNNLHSTCIIGFVNFNPYIDPHSPFNIMFMAVYNTIIRQELVYTGNNIVGIVKSLSLDLVWSWWIRQPTQHPIGFVFDLLNRPIVCYIDVFWPYDGSIDDLEVFGLRLEVDLGIVSRNKDEDAYEHVEKVLEITSLFSIPRVLMDTIMLRVFPSTLVGVAKIWMGRVPVETVNTWDLLKRGDMLKLKERVHAIQVGREMCGGTHLEKDCNLKEEVKSINEIGYGEGKNNGVNTKYPTGPSGSYTPLDKDPV